MKPIMMQVLMENTARREGIWAEHGLSLSLETPHHHLLFDMGQSGHFADNARQMGVDLGKIDLAILSHGHYDHGGGLAAFWKENDWAPVYLSQYAFEPHYSGRRYIGLDTTLREHPRLRFTGDHQVLDQELELFSCNERLRPYETDWAGLYRQEGEERVPEDFRHEQYLLIHAGGRRILISGCSHKGILNLMEWFQPDILVGGFHLMGQDPEGEGRQIILDTAHGLAQYPTTYYTGHCTGSGPFRLLKDILGGQLREIHSGDQVELI